MTPVEVLDMGKKKSESRRFNTLVRMDDELVEKAKKVAALKGISLAEFFSDALRPIVDREMAREVKKLVKDEEGLE